MSAHIERCPFCGSEADMQNDFGVDYWVQCKSLECGAVEGSIHSSPAPALARWNRRAPQPPAVKEAGPAAPAARTTSDVAYESLSPERKKKLDADMLVMEQQMQDHRRSRERRQHVVPVDVEKRLSDRRGR